MGGHDEPVTAAVAADDGSIIPQVQAGKAIDAKLAELGGTAVLGEPTMPVSPTPDHIGYFRHFANRWSIYWTPETDAHEVHGAIREKWAALGWEIGLGYPTTDETEAPDTVGRFNHFSGGTMDRASIYWTPRTGAHEVHGDIHDKWAALGWEKDLGYPVADEVANPDVVTHGRYSAFERGFISWSPDTGATDHANGTHYSFSVDSLVCRVTRSGSILGGGKDTLIVTARADIGPQQIGPVTKNIGDVAAISLGAPSMGYLQPHPIGLVASFDADDPAALVVVSFQINNSADGDTTDLRNAAREGFDTMKSAAVGAAVGSIGGVPGAAVGAVIGVLWSAIGKNLFANCDGPIAADSVHVSGATLNDQTGSGRHSETKNYPGVDSPGACGDNSNYDVTWSIGRA